MKICPNCQTQNFEGVFFCDECGQNLTSVASISTKAFSTGNIEGLPKRMEGVSGWGTASFAPNAALLLHIRDYTEPLKITPGNSQQLIIGRLDPNTGVRPEIDLAPYGAQEQGVSRSHAALRRMEASMTITDLGSVNGTYLNGQRLIAQQPRLLRDGDELRIGKVVMHVYFK